MSAEAGLPEAMERLLEKYGLLARLRETREAAEASGLKAFPRDEERARSEAFRRIAHEFPGSLRELEVSTAGTLRVKERAVSGALAAMRADPDRAIPAAWIRIVIDYHATLREALAVKAWLSRAHARGRPITEETEVAFEGWHARYPHRHGVACATEPGLLERHRRPPRGRLHDLVWEYLERRHGRERRELEAVVYGPASDPIS